MFRGEWWKPVASSTVGIAQFPADMDLELGATNQARNWEKFLGLNYYERLCRDEFVKKRMSSAREVKIYVLTHLRHLALSSVNDKLLFLENQLTGCGHLNEEEFESLITLLRRQGSFLSPTLNLSTSTRFEHSSLTMEFKLADLVRDFEYITQLDKPSFEHLVEENTEISARSRFPEYDGLPHLGDKLKRVLTVRPMSAKTLVMHINRALPSWFTSTASERAKRKDGYTSARPPLVPSIAVRAVAAAITTLAGGAFIILPMVFMCFSPSLKKSLVTVSVSVLAFGFTIDTFIARVSSETFIATATYSAVLIVFVAATGLPT